MNEYDTTFEVGDMLICARDYGIIVKVEEPHLTISWHEKGPQEGSAGPPPSSQSYCIDAIESTIHGPEGNKLVKGNQ